MSKHLTKRHFVRVAIAILAIVGATLAVASARVLHGSSVLTPCASTGVFDLSNTCNDIYFIGALK